MAPTICTSVAAITVTGASAVIADSATPASQATFCLLISVSHPSQVAELTEIETQAPCQTKKPAKLRLFRHFGSLASRLVKCGDTQIFKPSARS